MNWIDEQYSEQTDERILTQDNNEIIRNLLCEEIKNLKSQAYKLRMVNLKQQRELLHLRKQLKTMNS